MALITKNLKLMRPYGTSTGGERERCISLHAISLPSFTIARGWKEMMHFITSGEINHERKHIIWNINIAIRKKNKFFARKYTSFGDFILTIFPPPSKGLLPTEWISTCGASNKTTPTKHRTPTKETQLEWFQSREMTRCGHVGLQQN